MENESKFREEVINTAEKAMGWINDYFTGKMADDGKISKAIKMVQFGVKMTHLNQIRVQGDKSLAIRLLKFLPEDKRKDYIAVTNPEAKPFLLDKPSKKKKKPH